MIHAGYRSPLMIYALMISQRHGDPQLYSDFNRQYTTVNPPSGRVKAAIKLQAGTPSACPISPAGLPPLSKICQANEPPFFQPIPSVQASSVSPRALPTTAGYLRPFASPGAATGCDISPVEGVTTP